MQYSMLSSGAHRHLPSFPTRRSSDLTPGRQADAIIGEEVEQMVLSERLGFDSVWITEHHYADYGLSAAPSVLLATVAARTRSEEHTSELQSQFHLVCRLLLEKKKPPT